MKTFLKTGFVALLVLAGGISSTYANLIQNGSFEDIPNVARGQGILPAHWVNIPPPVPTADTYSNDGSYGLAPRAYGNFPGVTAKDGIRWVAGWSAAGQESFGQWLDGPLVAGVTYTLSGWLHQALRPDLNNSGGYEIYITDTPGAQGDSHPGHYEYLGYLGQTSSPADGWNEYSFSFLATNDMAGLTFLEFAPVATGNASAYPGLDLVSLTAAYHSVPEPASVILLLTGMIGMVRWNRLKKI